MSQDNSCVEPLTSAEDAQLDRAILELSHDAAESALAAELSAFVDDVCLVIDDKHGPGETEWALAQPVVFAMIRHLHGAGAHAGFVASRVREYIATHNDLEVARKHRSEQKWWAAKSGANEGESS